LRVGANETLRVPFALPAVVNIDINVTRIAHAAGDQRVRRILDQLFIDSTSERIPRVPAHRRTLPQLGELARGARRDGNGDALCVSRIERDASPEKENTERP
jgi:hypothetical protein